MIPNSLYKILCKYRDTMILPTSQLMAYAIDRELDCERPFEYPCDMPKVRYVQHGYIAEAQRIARYLNHHRRGLPLQLLMLNRRDMDIASRETFMLAVREILMCGMAELVDPPKRLTVAYPENYKFLKLKERR